MIYTVDNGSSWIAFYANYNNDNTYFYIKKSSVDGFRIEETDRGPNDRVCDMWITLDGVEAKLNVNQITTANAEVIMAKILEGLDGPDLLVISPGNLYGLDYDSNYYEP